MRWVRRWITTRRRARNINNIRMEGYTRAVCSILKLKDPTMSDEDVDQLSQYAAVMQMKRMRRRVERARMVLAIRRARRCKAISEAEEREMIDRVG